MFFSDLLGKEIYEEYDARPQLLRCGGNKATGSVELLVDDGETDGDESVGGMWFPMLSPIIHPF